MEHMKTAHESGSQDRILQYLKRQGPQTAAQLAKRLGVSPVAVRQQLDALLSRALVDYEDVRGKVGRPARHWSLSQKGHARFGDGHADLALSMIEAARQALGPAGLQQLLEARKSLQIKSYRQRIGDVRGIEKRVAQLAAIRREEGYMAECRRTPDGDLLLIENHCPICAAAKACQGVCDSELSLFREVLDNRAHVERTEHIVAGQRRCVYRITRARKLAAKST